MYNKFIDHTLLRANASTKEIINLCRQAKRYDFMSVCINPCHVKLCKQQLRNTTVKVCTVVGFPLGGNTTSTKLFETQNAIDNGADEIDMVINIGWLKQKCLKKCIDEIKQIKKICKKHILKVIVETALLNNNDKINACYVVKKSGADFIKTSTGFSTNGADVNDIKLFRKNLPLTIKIKASGGIKTKEKMVKMINVGATRIGTSNGVDLIRKVLQNDKT